MASANPWAGGPANSNGDGLEMLPTSSSSSSGSNRTVVGPVKYDEKITTIAPFHNTTNNNIWSADDDGPETEANSKAVEQKPKMAESWGQIARAWPMTTLCIVSNEFCERFSYYGMRAVLTLYLLNVLKFSNDTSTIFFNGFTVLCYLTPLLGSILADGYIGKFRTIFFVSILYTAGQILLAVASTQGPDSSVHPWLDLLGLAIIGFGTGGIKPCVCAFGGDQFEPHQEKMISIFFSAFYFSINAGSMISTFITPMFRATPCLGQDSCYPMAFGIPALLMVFATLVFMAGSFWYKKPPPKENIFGEVYRVSKKAAVNRWQSQISDAHGHWLDYFFDSHFCAQDQKCRELQKLKKDPRACHKRDFVADIKSLLRLMVMYLPAPMFWALYDQQGSRWLIQAVMMDSRLWGDTLLLPDQMTTLNAVLILLFIPIFQVVIYPLVSCCFKITPLRKMVAGGTIAALAFVVSAAVQFQINKDLAPIPESGHAFVSAINGYDGCNVTFCTLPLGSAHCPVVMPNQTTTGEEMFQLAAGKQRWEVGFEGTNCPAGKWTVERELADGNSSWMLATAQGVLFGDSNTKKATDGNGEFSLGITLALEDLDDYRGDLALCRLKPDAQPLGDGSEGQQQPCNPEKANDFYRWNTEDFLGTEQYQRLQEDGTEKGGSSSKQTASLYAFKTVRPGNWALFLLADNGKEGTAKEDSDLQFTPLPGASLAIGAQGGIYLLAVTGTKEKPKKRVLQVAPDNRVSILWQVPQIAIITAGEILFAITGYEFAYSQAAPSMKSLVQALWLLTTATGDSIIVLITLLKFPNMAVELLFYAVGMLVVMFVLALLSIFYYEYNYYTGDGDQQQQNSELASLRKNSSNGRWSPEAKKPGAVQMYGSNEDATGGGGGGQANPAFHKSIDEDVGVAGVKMRL